MNCDRCSKPTNSTKGSWFNIDTLSPTHLAIWLATCDEMARLDMEAS